MTKDKQGIPGGDHGHPAVRMLVWAYIDERIADSVRYLMELPGVTTHTSCQGGLDYPPYVMVTWEDEAARTRIVERFDLTDEGDRWAYAHPRGAI